MLGTSRTSFAAARKEEEAIPCTVIEPGGGPRWSLISRLWKHRDLVLLLVHRDFVSRYKQSLLGPCWFVLQPLALTLVFSLVFARLGRLSTDAAPPLLFYLTGLLFWTYFSTTVQATSGVFSRNAHLFSKVFFPRLCVPVASALSNLLALLLNAVIVIVVALVFQKMGRIDPDWGQLLLWLPILAIHATMAALGVGLFLSVLTARYRDATHALPLLLQIWLYATPVIYSVAALPAGVRRLLLLLNPMAAPVAKAKNLLLGPESPGPTLAQSAGSLGICALFLLIALAVFQRTERSFIDTV